MLINTIGRHLAGNAIGYLALVVATSGTAYAAATIGSAEVIDNSLRSIDISDETTLNGGLSGIDIRTNTLTGADIQEGTLAKVPNADLLDGLDSSGFVAGPGAFDMGALALPSPSTYWYPVLETADPAVTVGYECPGDLAQNGRIVFENNMDQAINVFVDNGSENAGYQQMSANGEVWNHLAAPAGEHLVFHVQVGGPKFVAIEVFSVHRVATNDCHIQVTATVHR
ncbi:hypothetical protein F0U44_09160 [Nocardioides humilatus]|uniref:Uncharacterized protein n=1 Tax=Nocardioides humilatus TaxID=2607660 RepID=A0A5B1LG79_9ACTN|nr:hypothetical protein [Nocardioides humilatus]KAA1418657.1 hypothetical protein F0U44_09160 [Nocardioides humilatus]